MQLLPSSVRPEGRMRDFSRLAKGARRQPGFRLAAVSCVPDTSVSWPETALIRSSVTEICRMSACPAMGTPVCTTGATTASEPARDVPWDSAHSCQREMKLS
jgi:hypothetical protein